MKKVLPMVLVLMILGMATHDLWAAATTDHQASAPTVTPSPSHEADLASGAHEEAPRGLLDWRTGDAVWSAVLFLMLFAALAKFVWPAILKALQQREEKIRQDITSAEQANRQAQQTLEDYKARLAKAHAEARQFIDQARADAESVRTKMVNQTEEEIARLRNQATDQIRLAKQQAVQDLYTQTAELTTEIAAKVLQRQINEEDAHRLVEQSLAELNKL